MFQTSVVVEIKTHVVCSITFFLENHVVYEIMWKNIVERDRPQMTIWRMHIACWMFKATNAHSKYVITTYCLSTVPIDA
jgi:aminopeptidase C